MHVHCADGEAKFWLDPEVSVAVNHGLSKKQVSELARIVEERRDEISESWNQHFGR